MSRSSAGPVCLIAKAPLPGLPDAFPLGDVQTTVGRHPTNNIVLAFESVSRFHARIDRRGDYYILQDLNSSNGTFVNNEKVTQMTIHHGDAVTFGNVEFVFQNESSQSGLSTHSSSNLRGKKVVDVDILEDKEAPPPVNQSVRKAEDIAKEKSSVISSVAGIRQADKNALLKVNQRLQILYRLSEMLREVSGSQESEILEKVLDLVFEALVADRGVVLLRNAVDAGLEVSAVKYRDKPITPQKVSVSRTILDKVLSEKVAVLSKDAQNDDRFGASESIIMSQTRSTICVPMLMSGAVMGAMHLDTSSAQRSFSDDDLEFAMIIATEAAVAIDNMRMRSAAIHRERLAAVGETVAGISHNVKNILLLSQGGAELLSRAIDKGDMQGARDSWAVVKRGIDKIGALVRDMLEYSSNKKPDLRPANINDMVCAIAQEVEPQLIKKNVMLELDVDESIGERVVDDLGLQRTIYNLIVNAMEAIQHNEGQITIATSQRPDGTLVITIRDNGSGIPADKLEKIWYPFFTTKGSTGTGLGLPMCKKCVEDMNGRIYCESEENLGTLFTIEIPKIVPA
jgi:signal transduction histidine kinase/pSer/pThr/pTyr-binding forkhead associated (FHA) protein